MHTHIWKYFKKAYMKNYSQPEIQKYLFLYQEYTPPSQYK